jgi:hypothetical protein
MKLMWFLSGAFVGFTTLSVAMGSVPIRGKITDDTAIYQRLSEIQVPHQDSLNFDGNIQRLSRLEDRFHKDKLPSLSKRPLSNHPRISAPLQRVVSRVSQQKYRPVVRR